MNLTYTIPSDEIQFVPDGFPTAWSYQTAAGALPEVGDGVFMSPTSTWLVSGRVWHHKEPGRPPDLQLLLIHSPALRGTQVGNKPRLVT